MIRKSGVAVFLVIVAVIFGLVYFLAGWAIRSSMVYGLEKAFAAEVNIESVSVGLAPLALKVNGLQITDKKRPQYNVVGFHQAVANLELWPALMGYYVVPELSVTGLQYGAMRKSPGKVFLDEAKDKNERSGDASSRLSAMSNIESPDADVLMARMNLQTQEKGEALRLLASQQQEKIKSLESQLPDRQKLVELQNKIKAITDSKIKDPADLAKKTEELKALKDELEQQREKLKSVEAQLAQSRKALENSVAELNAAKEADWKKLQDLANIREGGIAPISQILLGEVWGQRVAQVESFYNLVKPYIPEAGEDEPQHQDGTASSVSIPNRILPLTNKPYPNVWIKTARLETVLTEGTVDITLNDVTAEHLIIGKPTRFRLDGENLPQLQAMRVEGDFAIKKQLESNATWEVSELTLEDHRVSGGALNLESGVLDSTGTIALLNDNIKQHAEVKLQSPRFSSSDEKYGKKLTHILNQQTSIPFDLQVEGTLESPDISISSKLDRILGDALLGEAKQKVKDLEADLRSQLDTQLEQQLSGQNQWLANLKEGDRQVAELDKIIEEALDAELKDLGGQAEDKIKDKLFKLGR